MGIRPHAKLFYGVALLRAPYNKRRKMETPSDDFLNRLKAAMTEADPEGEELDDEDLESSWRRTCKILEIDEEVVNLFTTFSDNDNQSTYIVICITSTIFEVSHGPKKVDIEQPEEDDLEVLNKFLKRFQVDDSPSWQMMAFDI
eukprot:TRINITY_DN6819_c0_g1_i1.p1 TRINITY_DN6819_c0_g1~~TRINITY_DN6819_c0_g1_i1.p1  ORF type:complete len:156 (-),score=50.63 TRINITY_DN6819_c0_g1_i1:34-465(-)